MLSQPSKESLSFQLHHSHMLKVKAFKMKVMNVAGQLIYNFVVIASPVFQVGIFFKRKKKNTARLKDFSWQNQNKNLEEKHLPVETSYNYKNGSGFELKHRLQLKLLLTSM